MKAGMPITPYKILLGAISLFLVAVFALHFSPVKQAYSSSCNFTAFKTCRDTFNLQGCIDACPYVPITCPPGTPPNTDCKETDQACSDACWDRGNTHGSQCAQNSGCTMAEIETYLKGGTVLPAATSPQPTKSSPPDNPPQQLTPPLDADEEKYDFVPDPLEEIFTESLVETKPKPGPSKEDLKNVYEELKKEYEKRTNVPKIPKGLDAAFVYSMEGLVQSQFEGEADWKNLELGTPLWTGTLIQTDFDASVTLLLSDGSTVKLSELTQVGIEKLFQEKAEAKKKVGLNIHLGDMNLDVNAGNFSADTQIRAGNPYGGVSGTHFGVAYDPKRKTSVWEIYDGTIEVTSEEAGKTVVLTSSYGKPIKRAEISDSGEIALKIAIPKDEWGTDKTKSETQDLRFLIMIGLIAVAVIILVLKIPRKRMA